MRKPFSYDTIHIGEVLGVREVRIISSVMCTYAMELVAIDEDSRTLCRSTHTSLRMLLARAGTSCGSAAHGD